MFWKIPNNLGNFGKTIILKKLSFLKLCDLDRKILDLADRINKKKMAQNQHTQLYTNVAPVKPVVQDKLQVIYKLRKKLWFLYSL